MTDVFSKQKRSEIMSLIRSKNTAIELNVFRFLRRNSIYFQKNYKRAMGSPDVALPRKKKAVFIDGDFWHGWKVLRVWEHDLKKKEKETMEKIRQFLINTK